MSQLNLDPNFPEAVGYRVAVNGRNVPVLRLFSTIGFGYKKSAISYCQVQTKEPVAITVTANGPIQSFQATPDRDGIELDGNELSLVLPPLAKQGLRINDGEWLFLFIDPPDEARPDLLSSETLCIDHYGVDKTGQRVETEKLQRAIDDAAALGRSATVFLSAGIYRTGSLWIKSNVTLYLDAGAVVLGDDNHLSYPQHRYTSQDRQDAGTDPQIFAALIWFEGVRNAAIRGCGTIDGQGSRLRDLWRSGELSERIRSNSIRIVDSQDVSIEGVVIRDAEFWSMHLLRSRRLNICNVKILNEMVYKGWDIRNPDSNWNNTDGIDPDSCSDVLVESAFIYTGDDCLVLKTTNSGPHTPSCENVVVRGCLLAASTAAIKFGTESVGPAIRKITFEDIVILKMNSGRCIGFVAKDISLIEYVTFKNIRIESPNRWLGMGIPTRMPEQKELVRIRHVVFENIDLPAESEGQVTGRPNADLVSDICFSNIRVAGRPASRIEDAGLRISHVTGLIFEPGSP